ncbi:hypothetical protein WJX74_000960 [Apatococcus lobatus]|uniref:Uncharacterized protein n=1 Tax=Apatococcus lobatus TaxID=904363 RepID=A0AAW1Q277_9CHLO
MGAADDGIRAFVSGVAFATLILTLGRLMDFEMARMRARADVDLGRAVMLCLPPPPPAGEAPPAPTPPPSARSERAPSDASDDDWEGGSDA